MNKPIRLILAVFAVYRLASLITSEEGPYLHFWQPKGMGIFEKIRMELGAFEYGSDGKPESNLARGITCPLCVGLYLAVLATALVALPSRLGDVALVFFGVAGGQIFLENLTSDDAIEGAIGSVAESLDATEKEEEGTNG